MIPNQITNPSFMNAYDLGCMGCIHQQKDVMVSTSIKNEEDKTEFVDIFLTLDQAVKFQEELNRIISQNQEIIETTKRLVQEGKTPKEIAREFSMRTETIERVIKDHV